MSSDNGDYSKNTILYTSLEGAKLINKVFKEYVKSEQLATLATLDTSVQPDYEGLEKQRILEKYERLERNSSAKTRNPMRHLTPKKKKRR